MVMKTLRILRLSMSIAAAVLIGSCTPDGGTIYATIETEVKTTDNSLPNTLTTFDIVKAGANTYYVAAGTIFKGVLGGGTVTWTPNSTSADRIYNKTGSLSNALAYDGTNLWAGFITTGANLGLYSSGVPPTTSWTSIIDPVVKDKQVYLIRPIGPDLFVVCGTVSGAPATYHYELEHYSGAWSGPLFTALPSPIVGVATDGTNYYMASGATVYYTNSPTGAFATTGLTLGAGDEVEGIFGVVGKVFVATKKGGLYHGTGAAWTQIVAPVVGSATVALLTVSGPVDLGGDKYLVGSDGFGYFTLSVSAGTLARFSDSTIGLYAASVRRILVDGSTVFMGTNGAGLWRATFDTAAGAVSSAWTHE